MKLVAQDVNEQDEAILDPWSVVHFGFGLAAGLMEINGKWAFGGAVLYEVVEHMIQSTDLGEKIFKTPGTENYGNSVADVAIFMLGWYGGSRWIDGRDRPSLQ